MSQGPPSFLDQVRLVAGREIRERGGSRSFKASTAITVLIVLALLIVPKLLESDDAEEWTVAVVGTVPDTFVPALEAAATAQDATVEVEWLDDLPLPGGAGFEAIFEDTDADAVLVDGRVVTDGDVAGGLRTALSAAWAQSQVLQGLADAGLAPDEATSALDIDPIEFSTSDEEEGNEDTSEREAAAFIGVVALFIAINSYGAWVLTGVLEEKSSRVVEVVISAIAPRALLTGKVLGIGLLGLAQLVVVAAIGLTTAIAIGITEVPTALLPAVASMVVWFVLGFAFYSVGYAAAGSLATRQEDAQSAASPLAMLVLGAYFISLLVVGPNPESLAAKICSFVPFTAPLAMPARIAQGAVEPWEIPVSILCTLLGTWLMIRLAAGIYERSLLRTGAPIKPWVAVREAIGAGRARDAVTR